MGQLRCGVAGMASDHVWAMGDGLASQPEVELVAAFGEYPELRERAKERWKIQRTYETFGAMMDGEHLDAVLICSDNASKAEMVEAAAVRGIHVYADKPMAATLAQADRMLRAAEAAGITLMVAYHPVFSPLYHQVKRLILTGAVGKPYLARGVIGHGGPKEYGCSEYFCEFLFDKQRNGGGAFVDEACYMIDTFVDYFGPVSEVSAFTTQMGHRDYLPGDVEDNAVAILRFENGALGIIDAKWGQVGPMPLRTSFHGSHGTVLTSQTGTDLYTKLEGGAVDVPSNWDPVDIATLGLPSAAAAGLRGWRAPGGRPAGSGSGGMEQRHFVDSVLNKTPVENAASPRLARHVQEVIEAAYRSAETGRAVRLPLDG